MEEYKVGQILFLIGAKTTKIIPVQIVEEVIRTTIEGKEKTYTVLLPDQAKTKVDIKEVKGDLHKTWQSLRTKMLSNATKAIDTMITKAINISENVFEVETKKEEAANEVDADQIGYEVVSMYDTNESSGQNLDSVVNDTDVQQQKKDDIIKVDLGNGLVGNVSVDTINKMR